MVTISPKIFLHISSQTGKSNRVVDALSRKTFLLNKLQLKIGFPTLKDQYLDDPTLG